MASIKNNFVVGDAPDVTFSAISPLAFTTDGIAAETISVDVDPNCGQAISGVSLVVRDSTGTETTYATTPAGSTYSADIVFAAGTYLIYAISAHTATAITRRSPNAQIVATL